MREIVILMGRSPSTIGRELAGGSDASGRYRPSGAHSRALGRRRLQRAGCLAGDPELRDRVAGRLRARWGARGHAKVPTDGHEEVPTLDLIHEPG